MTLEIPWEKEFPTYPGEIDEASASRGGERTITFRGGDYTVVQSRWEGTWYLKRNFGQDQLVAVLGWSRIWHRPRFHEPRLRSGEFRSQKWQVLEDLGVEYHLTGNCDTQFWAQTWTLVPLEEVKSWEPLWEDTPRECRKCQT